MKTVKTTIFEYIQQEIYSDVHNQNGLQTKDIATALNLHRPNVSAILNELVKEGKLTKTNSRPVYYRLAASPYQNSDASCFNEMIGANGSLKNAIQLAKAAILYPNSSLNVLISAKVGCGTTYFASLMHKFAVEQKVLAPQAPFVYVDCRHYHKNIGLLDELLFGLEQNHQKGYFYQAKQGILFIDNVELLDAKQLSRLYGFLETGQIFLDEQAQYYDCSDVLLLLATAQPGSPIARMVPVIIDLPELKARPLKERLDLVNHLFQIEATNSKRDIEVTIEAIKALLLADVDYNIKGLALEIKAACANAYMRVVNEQEQDICVCVNDFKGSIKKGLLNLKYNNLEIDSLLGDRELIIYDKQWVINEPLNDEMYLEIQRQYNELASLGINDASIEKVMNTHVNNLFKKYRYYKGLDSLNNLEQLSKIVDQRVIDLVSKFLEVTKKELSRSFKPNVFYGLCLHLNSLLTLNLDNQRVDNDQIVKIIQDYPQEYTASVQFAQVVKDNLGLELPIQEVVLLAMFLIESDETSEKGHPVLLYIMHGDMTAQSLMNVTNSLTHCNNTYSYDLSLGMTTATAMTQIKELIQTIDQGQGVIVIYDMGSIKTMLEAISEEIDVKIRYINIPVTLVGIDIARKCAMETDVDYVYHMANLELNNMYINEEKHNEAIITLCHTGEGGALQLKRYIDQYSKLKIKTIPLAISSRDELLKEVMSLQKTYSIHCFVGTYDPKMFGIPFIPIAKVFEHPKSELDRIIMFEPVNSHTFDYRQVYAFLQEQFKYVSIAKLKSVLPDIIDEFSLLYNLNEDQRGGLFMHLSCLVERLLDGKSSAKNRDKNKILSVFEEDYQIVSKIIKPLEKTFKVIIDDDEIATIIMIIKKI